VKLDDLLEPIRATNGLPALAAVAVKGGQIVGLGATGFRKEGAPERVTEEDQFHIGSCTKSMTAVLAAMLVEEGRWQWTNTLAQLLPQLAPEMKPAWREVTLENLLGHRGGAPANLDADGLWGRLWKRAGTPPQEQRAYLARELLTRQEPAAKPGAKFIYSNAGYALVGHAIETTLGKPWETVLRERLFLPLGMTNAGFGPPATVGKVDQPWGHTRTALGGLKPVPPGPGADNPPAIGPAGTVHASLAELAAYCNLHLGHGTNLLKPASLERLRQPIGAGGDYAMGWVVTSRPWGGGKVLNHNGSNTMFYTVIWLAPIKDFAVVVCTNVGGDGAAKASDLAAWRIIEKFLPNP
jgi:CubicO group peptidase (beta-lactamase class C family)